MIDLVTLARRAQNYVLRNPDRRLGNVPHFIGRILPGPAAYTHWPWDACDVGWRLVEAGEAIRRMTGAAMGAEEECLRRMVFSTLMPDGLSYRRLETWTPHEAWMWDQGRALLALATLMERDRDPGLARIAEAMLRGLERIGIPWGSGGLYYPKENWLGDRWGEAILAHPPTGLQIEGAVLFAERSGREWPLDYARRVARTVLNRSPRLFNEDGSFVPMGGGDFEMKDFTHLHARLFITLGLARLAGVDGDADLLAQCRRVFDHALSLSTSYGWVPECPEQTGGVAVDEVCCIMDMIKLALFFARRGETGLYDVVERFAANQVPAHQVNDYSRVADRITTEPQPETRESSPADALERFLGGFTGSLAPHHFIRVWGGKPYLDVSGCCGPSGILCLYLAWEAALEERGDTATVWLHFSREGGRVKVVSKGVGGGHLEITPRQELRELRVRVHPWADRSAVQAVSAGAPVPVRLEGDLAVMERIRPGVPVTLRYPAPPRHTVERVAGLTVPVDWVGNEVVRIAPPPEYPPLYPFPA